VNVETQGEVGAATPGEGRVEALRQLAYRLHLSTTFLKFLIVGGWASPSTSPASSSYDSRSPASPPRQAHLPISGLFTTATSACLSPVVAVQVTIAAVQLP
jgi:hypothetical protein